MATVAQRAAASSRSSDSGDSPIDPARSDGGVGTPSACSPAQVSALAAVGPAVGALIALPLGPWVEFHRKRPVMIAMDLIRFAALVTVPLAYLLGLEGVAEVDEGLDPGHPGEDDARLVQVAQSGGGAVVALAHPGLVPRAVAVSKHPLHALDSGRHDRQAVAPSAFEIEGDRIVAIYIMRNPDKLARVTLRGT